MQMTFFFALKFKIQDIFFKLICLEIWNLEHFEMELIHFNFLIDSKKKDMKTQS